MKTHSQAKKLSLYEHYGLSSQFNLSGAYPCQPLLPVQQDAVADLVNVFMDAHASTGLAAKQEFEQNFFRFAGQPSVQKLPPILTYYSGSIAIEVMANYLRLQKKSVTLMHPTFDTLADTLKRHGVPLRAMDEEQALQLDETSPRIDTDALYIVCPNNPTGRCPSRQQFINIVSYCKKYDILLVIDFCFRFYGPLWDYDQYQIMQDAGISFITTEDTGKIWPTAELKLGMLLSDQAAHDLLATISHDFLVEISLFIFMLSSRYLELESADKKRLLSQDSVDANRRILQQALHDSPLELINPESPISIAWLKLPKDWFAEKFVAWLHDHGIQVLPGNQFYWHHHDMGQHHIRIALLQPNFEAAMLLFGQLIDRYAAQKE